MTGFNCVHTMAVQKRELIFSIMKTRYIILISLWVFGCKDAGDSSSFDMVEANRTGIQILSRALSKHKDFYADSLDISFQIVCHNHFHPTQSQVPFHPMTTGFVNRMVWVNPKAGEEIFNSKLKAGSYIFHDVSVLQNDRRISYNVNTKTYEENDFGFTRNLPLIPQTYLRKALENQASIRALSILNTDNNSEILVESFLDGSQHKFWLDQDTVLVKVESLRYSSTYGQGLRSFRFNDNRRINGYLLPSEVIENYKNSVWDEVENIYQLNSINQSEVTSFLGETASYVPGDHHDRKMAEVVKLDDHIYVIENVTSSSRFWSYNVLFAEFNDYVLVAEAPVSHNISTLVMEKVKETIPNKPIKYVVQSHHHSDHLAGIKKYVEEGVTIITSDATSKVIDRISESFQYNRHAKRVPPHFARRVKFAP